MTDRNLIFLCLISAVLGILMIFYVEITTHSPGLPAGYVNEDYKGKTLSVGGVVRSKYYTGEHIFFDLEDDTGKIKVVVFEETIKKNGINPREIKNGMEIGVEGKTDLYEGEIEIIAKKLYLE